MSTTNTYHKAGEMLKITKGKTIECVPCLLFVTFNNVTVEGKQRTKITIKGRHNPFPFKELIVLNSACDIDKWLLENGYSKVAVNKN